MYNIQQIIEKAREVHGDKYDYSRAIYTKLVEPIEIICPKHGSFFQTPHEHLRGQGCPKCGIESRSAKKKYTTESFIQKAKKKHGTKYDYSKVKYIDSYTKVCIICPEHGEFWQTPYSHLAGKGCPICGDKIQGKSQRLSQDEFLARSKKLHGDKYDYSKAVYELSNKPVCIICPDHGEFWQTPHQHLIGRGCPKCAVLDRSKKKTKTTERFIKEAKNIHGNLYSYDKTVYKDCFTPVTITCKKHGDFEQLPAYHLSGNGCQKCGYTTSFGEDEIYNFIKELLPDENVVKKDKSVLNGYELDVYVPSKKIAIEFDGLYWHSEMRKSKNYHLWKTEECEKQGIHLIHIFEDEWIYKKDICKSRITNILGLTKNIIYARKCEIVEIQDNIAKEFIDRNHLQGYARGKYRYALKFKGKIVSVMTFATLRNNLGSKNKKGSYELLRFCNEKNCTVVGGASKLLKHFVNSVKPSEIITYADRRWSNGGLYEKIGFSIDHISPPNYFYIDGRKRKNRFCFRKDILVSKYGCSKEETEHKFCLRNGLYRIYDCGTKVYKMKF